MGNVTSFSKKESSGFSMAELLIVVSVIGILASISIPLYLEQKDNAIVGVTQANLNAMRSGLMQYTVHRSDNRYPMGNLHYFAFRTAIPEANLPPLETDAKIMSGTFSYSGNESTYTLRATSTNRTAVRLRASPGGIFME
jgi:prepilin-type N-terminal cleavage/methylation domain-containing protein